MSSVTDWLDMTLLVLTRPKTPTQTNYTLRKKKKAEEKCSAFKTDHLFVADNCIPTLSRFVCFVFFVVVFCC